MIILDYDGTYTRYQNLFNSFIRSALESHIDLIIATGRHVEQADDGLRELARKVPVFYTGGYDSKAAGLNAQGIDTTGAVWIDDEPKTIGGLSWD